MPTHRDQLLPLLAERSYFEGDFVLTSGQRSTYYIDLKKTSYDAEGRRLMGEAIADWIEAEGLEPDCVGGLTLGADAIAHAIGTAMARRGRPLRESTVRKAAKEHGRGRRIEGNFQEGDRVLVLDDVVTTGGSTIQAIEAYEEAGAEVLAAIAVVDREQGAAEAIAARGMRFAALFKLHEVQAARVGT
ncbi:MAG: orotate phosphoribosyltransferase [Candidatus Eiseniibacteriota bacterium]